MALSVEGTRITPLTLAVFVHDQKFPLSKLRFTCSGQCQNMKNLLLLLPKARTGLSFFTIWKMKVYHSVVAFLSYPLFTLHLFNTIQLAHQSQQIQLSVSGLCLRNHAGKAEGSFSDGGPCLKQPGPQVVTRLKLQLHCRKPLPWFLRQDVMVNLYCQYDWI